MTRRYRRNENLIPPANAYSPEESEEIEQFAASGERVVATDIGQWPDPDGTSDWYVDDGEKLAKEYLFPRREPFKDWREADATDGIWLVYFAELQPPSSAQSRLWSAVDSTHNVVDDYDVAVHPAYLFRGTGEEADDFAKALHAASLNWLDRESDAVVKSDAYNEHNEYEYVRVYDNGGPEDLVCTDGIAVVLQDTVFGWWWVMLQEDDTSESRGPYESEADANHHARRWAEQIDDRRRDERGMSADEVYMNRQPEEEDEEEDMPARERLRCERLHGTIAIVYQPKLKQLMSVVPGGAKSVDVYFGDVQRAHGYFDSETMDDCARTHSAGSGVKVGTGDGMALYTGLAMLAYQGCERECIGSCPTSDKYGYRSDDGNEWWKRAGQRGLADDAYGGCQFITLETLIKAGLVFWMREAGDYAGAIASAQEKYAAAFAAAEPDPDALGIIGDELEQILSSEDFEAWRAAHDLIDAEEVTPNRRGGRRGKRKPSFVTPELEAHVEALYEGLEGL